MGKDQDLYRILRAVQQQGFIVTTTRKQHWMIRDERGAVVAVVHKSGDWRAIRNTIAQLRRYGFQWPIVKR